MEDLVSECSKLWIKEALYLDSFLLIRLVSRYNGAAVLPFKGFPLPQVVVILYCPRGMARFCGHACSIFAVKYRQ